MDEYLIWSEEHGAWWGPSKMGYTRKVKEAGRYSRDEAAAIIRDANEHSPVGSFEELMFPAVWIIQLPS